jgi:hypothetical protein
MGGEPATSRRLPGLRIAQVWRGEVMEELYRHDPSTIRKKRVREQMSVVSVGTAPGVDLVTADLGLPPALGFLRHTPRGWLLTVGQGMGGEVAIGGRQQKVAELLAGGAALDRASGSAGSFHTVPVGAGDWGVVHLDGATGDHVIFFKFDSAPGDIDGTLMDRDSDQLVPPFFLSAAMHAYILIIGFVFAEVGTINFPYTDHGDALAGILVQRPEKAVEEQPKEVAGTDDGDPTAPPASSEGEEGKAGGEGEKPRMRVEDPGDTAEVDPTKAKVQQRGLLVHSSKLKKVGSAMQSDRLGMAMSRLKGNNEGGAGYGKGKGTGVGVGEGTGTLTKSSGKGAGGGGTAPADVVTGEKIDSGGTRAAKGVAGGSPKEQQVSFKGGDPEGDFEGLTKDQVYKTVMARKSALLLCFEKELQRKPNLNGTVTLTWHIKADGSVDTAKVKSSDMGDAAVEGCLVRRVKDLKFPKSADGNDTTVRSFPFVFAPRK